MISPACISKVDVKWSTSSVSEERTPSALGLTKTGKQLICSTFPRTSRQPKMLVAAGISRRLIRAMTAKEFVLCPSALNNFSWLQDGRKLLITVLQLRQFHCC